MSFLTDEDLPVVDGVPHFSQDAAAESHTDMDNARLAFHLDIVVLAAITIFVIISLPRAIARLSRIAEWQHGTILRHAAIDKRRRKRRRRVQAMNVQAQAQASPNGGLSSEDSHTLYSHSQTRHRVRDDGTIVGRSPYPPHIREWWTILHPIAPIFRYRVDVGLSLGQCFILAGYTGLMLYGCIIGSNPFTDPLRTGFVATSQIPFVYAYATKNNILGMLVGVGYEKVNYLHRFVGILVVIASNVHAVGYLYEWSLNGTIKERIRQTNIAWGFVALASLDVLMASSTSYWRHKFHNFFLRTHFVCFTLLLPALVFHGPLNLSYVIAAGAILGFDLLLRALKTRICIAHVVPLPTLSMTRLELTDLNAGWRAGQHVRLRILSSGMGLLGWAETHPFTVASAGGGEEGLVLMCKKAGRWTERLYEVAKQAGYGDGDEAPGWVRVAVEGPYGGPGHTIFASYSAAIFVVGGSGISFAMSAVEELVHKDLDGTSRIKAIELIWCVQDPASLTPLIPFFASLLQQSPSPLRVSVFYTRANLSTFPAKDSLPPGLTLSTGRPKLTKVLDSTITRCVSLGSGIKDSEDITGVLVGVCGPVGLGDDVSTAIGKVDPRRRKAVGGIELHEEVFGW